MGFLVPRRSCPAFLAAVCFLLSVESRGQEPPPLPDDKDPSVRVEPVISANSNPLNATADQGEDRQKRRQSAVAALLLLSLICGVFLFLILVVVFWARRIRQDVLAPLPEQPSVDPLWYLKQSRSEVPENGTATDEAD